MHTIERESMDCDVLIIGAGPAGLSAAIRLAQLNPSLNICVLEKAAEIGGHILSGAVLEPRALNQLIPDWRERGAPVTTAVSSDHFYYLSEKKSWRLPIPFGMKNQGNYIISLGRLCQWLAEQAQALGVNIFPGFAAAKVLYENDRVIGVQTSDMGLDKNGQATDRFQAGLNLFAKQTLFAEGCRGYLTEQLIKKYQLRQGRSPQSYGIGIKELWKIPAKQHQLGKVIHTIGWPLDGKTYGGSFIYHADNQQLALGLVIGLDYQNPYLDPFKTLQQFKTHPSLRKLLQDGECIRYGARALNEGGWQAIPRLTFPGGLLIGCAAGFLNVAKIKGSHTAMQSGMLAAEAIVEQLQTKKEITVFQRRIEASWLYQELYRVRNVRPSFHRGLWPGLIYSAIDQLLLRGKAPWTFAYHPDYQALKPAQRCQKITYAKPDGKISFDQLTQVHLTATRHREDQPAHLILKNPALAIDVNYQIYASPEQHYCPAGVYEIVQENAQAHLHIHASNCIHCKTCDIKDPRQNIIWQVPEGGEGPNYSGM